jgi:hypothetical protein
MFPVSYFGVIQKKPIALEATSTKFRKIWVKTESFPFPLLLFFSEL